MGLEQIQTTPKGNPHNSFIDFQSIETKEKIALALDQKLYWSVGDLEKRGVFASQEAWNKFKLTKEYQKYLVPGIVKGVLIAKHITP